MTPLKSYTLFDENSTNNTSEEIINLTGDTLYLTVYGDSTPSIQVEQLMDLNAEEWQRTELIIQKSPLALVSTITKSGLYEVPVSGARRIRLVNTKSLGSFTVYGTVGE